MNQLLHVCPAFSPHPIRDSNPEEKTPNAVPPVAPARTAAHPGVRSDRRTVGLPEDTTLYCSGLRAGVGAGVLSACWEPVRHGAAPPDTLHARGPGHRLLGRGSFRMGMRSWAKAQSQSTRGRACLLLTCPLGAADGHAGAQPSVEGAGFCFSCPPPPPPPEAQGPLAGRSYPGP